MALDLSRVERRNLQQDRVTTNRDGLLPSRNDTNAPTRQVNADLRSAQRGDGARALMEIFGSVEDATKSFQQYTNVDYAAKEEQRGAQGVIDQAAGSVDPRMAKKSRAYAEAVSTGEAQKSWYSARAKLEADIDEALNDPNDPATPEEIDEIISKSFSEFGLLEGQPRDFGSSKANVSIAQAMVQARPQLLQGAREIIKQQVEARSISTASANFREGVTRGDMTFEQAFSQVVPGTDLKAAKAALIDTAQEVASSLMDTEPDRAIGIIDSLLISKRKDGTPSFAPDELEKLRTERRQMSREAEAAMDRKEAESYEVNSDKVLDRFNRVPGSGSYPTVPEILSLRKSNAISAEFAGSMISSIRADRELNGSGTVSSSRGGSGGGATDGTSFTPAAGDLLNKVYSGQMTVGQASAVAARWAAEGRFGTGKARYKALADLRKNFGVVNSLDKEQRDYVKDNVSGWVSDAKARVRTSSMRASQRVRAEKEIDDAGKLIMERVTRGVGRPGYDAERVLSAGRRAASQAIRAKYRLN